MAEQLPDFNPRSPHGERLAQDLEETLSELFQSTLSSRRATSPSLRPLQRLLISIHALLTESDQFQLQHEPTHAHFNPRSPHGERHPTIWKRVTFTRFQSTLSSRRATAGTRTGRKEHPDFNPRSPHGERLPLHTGTTMCTRYFNPRSPHGERRLAGACPGIPRHISIHALLTESDHHGWHRAP